MRIRKHAKISPLVYAVSSLKAGIVLQPHVCQLNQSPWDVTSFSPQPSPPPSQVIGNGGSAGNGSSARSISAPEREHSGCQSEYMQVEEEHPPPPEAAPAVESVATCCKTDGKSWQCRREASKGHSLCEHHLSLVKSYTTNSSHHTTKNSAKPAVVEEVLPPRRSQKKAAAAGSSSNGHDFYYYSGFGPRWGKKRGESSRNKQEKEIIAVDQNQFCEDSDNVEYKDDDEEEVVGKKRVRKRIKANVKDEMYGAIFML